MKKLFSNKLAGNFTPLAIKVSIGILMMSTMLFIFSCANDDPDSGQLTQQFLMGDVTVDLSTGLAGARLKDDAVKKSSKTDSLKNAGVVAANAKGSNGRTIAFYDGEVTADAASKRTVIMSSKNEDELLIIIPATADFLEINQEKILTNNSMSLLGELFFDGESANDKYFTDTIKPGLVADGKTKIIPSLAKDIYLDSILDAYEWSFDPFAPFDPENVVDPDASFFKVGNDGNLVDSSTAFKFDATTMEKVEVGGKQAHEIVIDELAKIGKDGFSCAYATEGANTLYNVLECEMSEAYYTTLNNLRKLAKSRTAATVDDIYDRISNAPAPPEGFGEGAPPLPSKEEITTLMSVVVNATPGAAFWAVGIPVDILVEKQLNRINGNMLENAELIIRNFSNSEELVGILTDDKFATHPFITSFVDIKGYVGLLSQKRIVAKVEEDNPSMSQFLNEGPEESADENWDGSDIGNDIGDNIDRDESWETAAPRQTPAAVTNNEEYLSPAIFFGLVMADGGGETSTAAANEFCWGGDSASNNAGVAINAAGLKRNLAEIVQAKADDLELPADSPEHLDAAYLIGLDDAHPDMVGSVKAVKEICADPTALVFLFEPAQNDAGSDILPGFEFYSYEFFDVGSATVMQTMGKDLE